MSTPLLVQASSKDKEAHSEKWLELLGEFDLQKTIQGETGPRLLGSSTIADNSRDFLFWY